MRRRAVLRRMGGLAAVGIGSSPSSGMQRPEEWVEAEYRELVETVQDSWRDPFPSAPIDDIPLPTSVEQEVDVQYLREDTPQWWERHSDDPMTVYQQVAADERLPGPDSPLEGLVFEERMDVALIPVRIPDDPDIRGHDIPDVIEAPSRLPDQAEIETYGDLLEEDLQAVLPPDAEAAVDTRAIYEAREDGPVDEALWLAGNAEYVEQETGMPEGLLQGRAVAMLNDHFDEIAGDGATAPIYVTNQDLTGQWGYAFLHGGVVQLQPDDTRSNKQVIEEEAGHVFAWPESAYESSAMGSYYNPGGAVHLGYGDRIRLLVDRQLGSEVEPRVWWTVPTEEGEEKKPLLRYGVEWAETPDAVERTEFIRHTTTMLRDHYDFDPITDMQVQDARLGESPQVAYRGAFGDTTYQLRVPAAEEGIGTPDLRQVGALS
ncbi:MAG: hypothetical protein SVW77_02505 [Candidatus Nanohaloarchaea archaeon]|nr:hypothetical protein [Candidatus Nanohaloarchaea archaeon]